MRFPLGLRLHRRYEALTQWKTYVTKHVPHLQIPTGRKAWHRLPKQAALVLQQNPEFRALHERFRPNMALVIERVEEAIRHQVLYGGWSSTPGPSPGTGPRSWSNGTGTEAAGSTPTGG